MENRRVVTAMRTAVGLRNYQRARSRALTRLANKYYETYREFLEEEKQRDEMEGKKWHSLADNPASPVAHSHPSYQSTTSGHTEEGSIQGNDGGEA